LNTYGTYRDDTARALATLLSEPTTQRLASEQLLRAVGCRDIVLTSLRRQFRLATGAAADGSLRLPAVETNPVAAFGAVMDRLPTAGPAEAPTNVLAARTGDPPYVETWRQAARSSLLAADVLDSTQAWRPDPQATWAVVADTTEATWALSVLDPDLAALAKQCSDHETARQLEAAGRSGIGLLSRLTVELARQGAFNPNLDRLTRPTTEWIEPRPLSRFSQAADGEQRVARMMHQRNGVVPVKALGQVLVGQARIAAGIDEAASQLQAPDTAPRWLNEQERDTTAALAGAARARAEALTHMARARKGVADTLRGGEPLVWQTAEVLRALQRRAAPATKSEARTQLREVHRLAERHDVVDQLLVRGILGAFARGEYLVPHPDRNQLQWRPCTAEAEPPLREATEVLDRVLKRAVLPSQLEYTAPQAPLRSAPAAPRLLTEALASRRPNRPTAPGMDIGQPLTP
jgi:hypothetical protein